MLASAASGPARPRIRTNNSPTSHGPSGTGMQTVASALQVLLGGLVSRVSTPMVHVLGGGGLRLGGDGAMGRGPTMLLDLAGGACRRPGALAGAVYLPGHLYRGRCTGGLCFGDPFGLGIPTFALGLRGSSRNFDFALAFVGPDLAGETGRAPS